MNKEITKYPLLFQDNRIQRFYIGGKLMNEWRKMEAAEDTNQCEELLCTSIGAISKGKPDGYGISKTIEEQGEYLLSDIIKAYPEEVLGKEFHEYNPNQLSVLARVGDTTVRLVFQCHLRREDAKKYFNMPMGKTEAWYIARTREVPGKDICVYAGFKKDVTKEHFKELFDKQDVDGMVNCLHKIPVKEGQTILIPAGMPHCVGPGCLFLEYHECNDVTIRVERNINGMTLSDEEMFNGLKAEEGMNLFDFTTYDEKEIQDRVVMNGKSIDSDQEYEVIQLIDEKANDSFGIQLLKINGSYSLPAMDLHRVLVAVDQDVTLQANGKEFTLVQGHAALVPANCKDLVIKGNNCQCTLGIPYLQGKEE